MISCLFQTLTDRSPLRKAVQEHFKGVSLAEIVTAARDFPVTSRVNVQKALGELLPEQAGAKLFGIHAPINQEIPTMAHLFTSGPFPIDLGPLQHDEVDIGDATPVRCMKNGLWLSREKISVHRAGSPRIPFGVFNAFNHPQFTLPNSQIGVGTVGTITATQRTGRFSLLCGSPSKEQDEDQID